VGNILFVIKVKVTSTLEINAFAPNISTKIK